MHHTLKRLCQLSLSRKLTIGHFYMNTRTYLASVSVFHQFHAKCSDLASILLVGKQTSLHVFWVDVRAHVGDGRVTASKYVDKGQARHPGILAQQGREIDASHS